METPLRRSARIADAPKTSAALSVISKFESEAVPSVKGGVRPTISTTSEDASFDPKIAYESSGQPSLEAYVISLMSTNPSIQLSCWAWKHKGGCFVPVKLGKATVGGFCLECAKDGDPDKSFRSVLNKSGRNMGTNNLQDHARLHGFNPVGGSALRATANHPPLGTDAFQHRANDLWVAAMLENAGSLEASEHPFTRAFVHFASGGSMKVASHDTLKRNHLQRLYDVAVASMKRDIAKMQYVAAEADYWTEKGGFHHSYLGVVIHWLSFPSFERVSMPIGLEHVPGTHSATITSEVFFDILERFGIKKEQRRLIGLLADAAMRAFLDQAVVASATAAFAMNCPAHIINLAIDDVSEKRSKTPRLDYVRLILDTIHDIMVLFRRRPLWQAKLEAAELEELQQTYAVIISISGRWYSRLEALYRAHLLLPSMVAALSHKDFENDREAADFLRDLTLFRNDIPLLCETLEPCRVASKSLESSNAHIGLMLGIASQLQSKLEVSNSAAFLSL